MVLHCSCDNSNTFFKNGTISALVEVNPSPVKKHLLYLIPATRKIGSYQSVIAGFGTMILGKASR